jgi:hypothetical protein
MSKPLTLRFVVRTQMPRGVTPWRKSSRTARRRLAYVLVKRRAAKESRPFVSCQRACLSVVPALKAFSSAPAFAFFVGVSAPVPTRALPPTVVPAMLMSLIDEIFCFGGSVE